MDSLEQRAREELKQSQIALSEAKRELRDARKAVDRLKVKVETIVSLLDTQSLPRERLNGEVVEQIDDDDDVTSASNGRYAGMTTVQVMEDVLTEAGGPLRIIDIVSQAIGNGYGGGVGNADADRVFAVFSSALSRDVKSNRPRFRKVDRGIFDLASRVPF